MSIVRGRSLERPDGRIVRFIESGTPDGAPLLVFHPTPSSRLFVRQHADAALRTGVRLLAASRPGSGGSSMADPGLRVAAEDSLAVAAELGLTTFGVLGFSGGTPFAAAAAALAPERVLSLGLVSPVAPWREVEDRGVEHDAELEELLALDRPAALEGLLARAERQWGARLALDDEGLARALRKEATGPDAAYVTRVAAFADAVTIRDALADEDEQPAYEHLAFDELAFGSPWDVDVSTVTAPTWIWQGSLDEVTPPEMGRWWEAHVPGARLVMREGAGHLGAFEGHREETLSTLAR